MLPPLIAKGDPGITLPLVIDGIVLDKMPRELTPIPEPTSDYLDMMDGGAYEFQRRPFFDGASNYSDRFTFTFPYDALRGENREKMELIRVTGGLHRVTLWRMMPARWTCKGGVQRYYLPRMRKCAAHLYDGLAVGSYQVSTDLFPTVATLNGVELDVSYVEGPTISDPGAGGLRISRQPDDSGAAMDHTAMRLGDVVVTGDDLIVWMAFTYECSMRAPSIRLLGTTENHAYTFVEV